jgi:hypothetical protein
MEIERKANNLPCKLNKSTSIEKEQLFAALQEQHRSPHPCTINRHDSTRYIENQVHTLSVP